MPLNRELCRCARAYLDWNQDVLASKAGIGLSTLRDFERGVRTPIKQNLLALERALGEAGVDLAALEKAFARVRAR